MGEIRVATYNLHHGAPPGRRFNPSGLAKAISRLGAEVIALQEVDRRVVRTQFRDLAAIAAKATGLYPTFVMARPLGPLGQYGIALLTPEPPTAVEVIRLPDHGREPRVAVMGQITVGGKQLTVAATHLQNRASIAQAQLEVLCEKLMRRPGPRLLMGDMNMRADRVEPIFARHGIVAAESGPTFPTRGAVDRIDWIAGTGIELTPGVVRSLWASDHFPLTSTITITAD